MRLLRGVASEDGSLDGSAVSNSLIQVDGFVRLFAIEEVGDEFDDAWDASRATKEDDLVNAVLVDLRITENLLDWLEGRTEEVLAKFFETGTSDGGVKVDTLGEGVDLNGSLGG